MNSQEIKHKFNVVGIICTIGAAIAFAGAILAYTETSKVSILDIIVYFCVLLVGISNIRPSIDVKAAFFNVIAGVLGLIIAGVIYMNIVNAVDAQSFTDVGYGIWMIFAGMIIFIVFCISDLMYKRSA